MAAKKRTFWNFAEHLEGDKVVWIIALMLILISIVCIFSSTSRLVTDGGSRVDIVRSQLVVVALGLGLIVVLYNIRDIKWIRLLAKFGFLISFGLLALLLSKVDSGFIKSIELNGARRILQVKGFQIHVFEVVKVMMVLYLAWAQDALKKKEITWNISELWKKIILIYGPFLATILMIIPGSNSAALFVGGIMFIVIVLGGGNFKELFVLGLAAVITVMACWGIYKISDGKAMKRIGTAIGRVFDDENYEEIAKTAKFGSREYYDAVDELRQPYGAKIAVKEGGLLGKGPGQSTQRYVVPDMSEDYMFSFIIEEYGVWGAILVIVLYVSLLARSSLIARNCKESFAKLTVAGLSLLICGQAFLHMFVNVDIGPMTGQTLPLISHGNSAFMCFCFAFGVILSISRISAKRIEKEQRDAQPLVELHESVAAGLDELDDFESGKNMDEETDEEDKRNNDEFNEYGV